MRALRQPMSRRKTADFLGMGLRMIMHLGLHLNINRFGSPKEYSPEHTEDLEIRKRVFWGAFVCEKLQSLYLGRPMMIHKKEIHVPKVFLDVYEEEDVWLPVPDSSERSTILGTIPTNSVTNFTQMCLLSEICGDIMSSFYAVHATKESTVNLLSARERIQHSLSQWTENLPEKLRFNPWSGKGRRVAPIHNILLQ